MKTVIELGRGEYSVDAGNYEGTQAIFIEPVSPAGEPGAKGPDLPLNALQDGTFILRVHDQRGAEVLAEKLLSLKFPQARTIETPQD
jgi:hypothetical protein